MALAILIQLRICLKKIGIEAVISSTTADIESADKLILPGVGSFEYGMNKLRSSPFFDILQQKVFKKQNANSGCLPGRTAITERKRRRPACSGPWMD